MKYYIVKKGVPIRTNIQITNRSDNRNERETVLSTHISCAEKEMIYSESSLWFSSVDDNDLMVFKVDDGEFFYFFGITKNQLEITEI